MRLNNWDKKYDLIRNQKNIDSKERILGIHPNEIIAYAWSREGKIFIRENEDSRPQKITNIEDLRQFKIQEPTRKNSVIDDNKSDKDDEIIVGEKEVTDKEEDNQISHEDREIETRNRSKIKTQQQTLDQHIQGTSTIKYCNSATKKKKKKEKIGKKAKLTLPRYVQSARASKT